MRHDFFDHHRSGNSLVHLADPRLKFFMMVSYILVLVVIPQDAKRYFIPLSFVPVILALTSGISFLHFLSKLAKIYPMIFFITFLLPFFPSDHEAGFKLGIFKFYRSGLDKFLLINVKSVLAVFMSIILTTTTEFNRLLKGMEKFHIPRIIILILSFMYRFIFLLIDEVERMLMAYNARYIHLPFFTRLKVFAQQIGVLFIRTYERSERVYQAMDARGFSGKIYTISDLNWKQRDSLLLALFIIILILPFLIL